MKKNLSYILTGIFAFICLGVSALTIGLVLNNRKDVEQIKNVQEQITSAEEDTGASLADESEKGGAIYVGANSSYTMTGGEIFGHTMRYGGAVFVGAGGTFNMLGGKISGNRAKYGGAIYVAQGGTLNLARGTITGNYSENGPAIYCELGATIVLGDVTFVYEDENGEDVNVTINSTSNEDITIKENFYEAFDFDINFYDGATVISTIEVDRTSKFNLGNAPLTYEESCGYFLDENYVYPIDHNDMYRDILKTAKEVGQEYEKGEIDLFTKSATTSYLTYTLNEDGTTYSVKQTSTSIRGEVVIPRHYTMDGLTGEVTSMTEEAFRSSYYITNFTMPTTIKTITKYAFLGSGVKKINIHSLVEYIKTEAFSQSGLTTVTIPGTVGPIEKGTFYSCKNLVNVKLCEGIKTVVASMFDGCSAIKEIHLPNSIETINQYAFQNCKLDKLSLGKGIKTITGFNVFNNCSIEELNIASLKNWCNITLSVNTNNPIYCAKNVYFDGATEPISELIIPDDVYSIKQNAFFSLKSLKKVVVPEHVNTINATAFNSTSLEELIIQGNGSPSIPAGAFSTINKLITYNKNLTFNSFTGLKTAELVDFVKVPDGMFSHCTGLTSVLLPETVEEIGSNAFYACNSLTNIDLSENITKIGANAFQKCISLTSFDVPQKVTKLEDRTFQECRALVNVSLHNNLKEIGNYVFGYSGITQINVPDSVTSIGSESFRNCSSLVNAVIGNGITKLERSLFAVCTKLESVTLSSNLVSIGENVFDDCECLKAVEFPANLETIGSKAFEDCESLENIKFLGNKLKTIGSGAFAKDDNLYVESVYVPEIEFWFDIEFASATSNPLYYAQNLFVNNVKTTEIVVPDNVTEIKPYAFYNFNGMDTLTVNYPVITYFDSFDNANVKTLKIGSNFEGASKTHFPNLEYLENIITDSVLGEFRSVYTLKSITFLENVTEVKPYTIFDCRNVSNIDFTTAPIEVIGERAFNSVHKVEELRIPNTVREIGSSTFRDMVGLKRLYMPESIQRIDSSAFAYNYYLKELHIANLEKWFEIDFVSAYSTPMYYADRVYINGSETNTDTITIPSGISEIKQYAISGTALKYITIPETVTSIKSFAFSDSGVISLVLPSTITKIEANTFDWCMGLGAIYIPATVTEILAETYSESPFNACVNRNINIFTEFSEGNVPDGWSEYWNVYGGVTDEETSEITAINRANTIYGASLEQFNNFVASDFDIQLLKVDPKFVYTDKVVYGYTAKEEYPMIPEGVTGMSATAFNQTDDVIYGVYIPESLVNIAVTLDGEGRPVGPFGMALENANYEFTVYMKAETIPEGFSEGWDIVGYDADGNAIRVTVETGVSLEDFKVAIDYENAKTFAPSIPEDAVLTNKKEETIYVSKNQILV